MSHEPQDVELSDPDGRLASLPSYLRQSVEWGIIDVRTAVRINIIRRASSKATADGPAPAETPATEAPTMDEAEEEVAAAESLDGPARVDITSRAEPDGGLSPPTQRGEPVPDPMQSATPPAGQAALKLVNDEVEVQLKGPKSYLPADQPYIPVLVDRPPDRNLRFDTFVPFKANAVAIELAQNVARDDDPLGPSGPLYVHSDVGLGKTHLLSAIVNQRRLDALLVNTADLDAELERAIRLGTRAELRRWLSARSLLVIDDIHLCEGNAALQRELLSVLDSMLDTGRIVVVSANLAPTHLRGVDRQLLGRLAGGVITALHMGDRDERTVILRDWLPGSRVPNEVVTHLADQVTDSVRHLKAVSARLSFLARQSGERVTVATAEAALSADAQSPMASPTIPPAPAAPIGRGLARRTPP